jgi:hypothetical protein
MLVAALRRLVVGLALALQLLLLFLPVRFKETHTGVRRWTAAPFAF